MWVFSKGGFVSAVEHRDDSRLVIVRARCREHLRGWGPISETPDGDYRYRTTMPKQEWSDAVAEMAAAVDYPNFKGSIDPVNDVEYHDALLDVWGVMVGYQERAINVNRRSAADSAGVGVLPTREVEPTL